MLLFEVAFFLLFIKHWYVDFVLQTPQMIAEKGVYGKWLGVLHSLQHAIATFIIFALAGLQFALIVAVIDFVTHYHIDWIKMNYGSSDISKPKFWTHLGLDQLAHSLVYLLIVSIFVRLA